MSFLMLLMFYVAYLALKGLASWEYDHFRKPKPKSVETVNPLLADVLEVDKSGPRFQRFLSRLRESPIVNFVADGSAEIEKRDYSVDAVFSSPDHVVFKCCHECPRVVDVRPFGLDLGVASNLADCSQRDRCFGPDKIAEFLMNRH